MKKKHLNTEAIMNELQDSVFFPQAEKSKLSQKEKTDKNQEYVKQTQSFSPPSEKKEKQINDTTTPRYHDTMIPSNHDTMTPSNHDTTIPDESTDIFEIVRKAVKQVGKEAATHRFTLEEKQSLADIEYTYKRQGIRTSENEITRIAINYFTEEYKKNGENSLLAKALKKLNS